MLIKARVENFKSFNDLTEFSMVSSSKIRMSPEEVAKHKVEVGKVSILKAAAVYGANASGKSNLIDVFSFFKQCIMKGLPLSAAQLFCKTHEANALRESVLELQFMVNGKFYAYGFSAILSKLTITAEWLYELQQSGPVKTIFTREGEGKPRLDDALFTKLSSDEKTRFNVYAGDFDSSTPVLFLSEMNRAKKISPLSRLACFVDVYHWLTQKLSVLKPNRPIANFRSYYDDTTFELINRLISTFDTGVSRVKIKEISFKELQENLRADVLHDLQQKLKEHFDNDKNLNFNISLRTSDAFFNLEVKDGGEPRITTLQLIHGKSFYDFEFKEESEGTQRLFDMISMLVNPDENAVYVVDELERSLHPKLTMRFLELFLLLQEKRKMQLIFTTHESTIMTQSLFRRDEIWFVERDADNQSHLYSLDRFKERYDKRLDKAYLEGRYGAIPVFSSFSDSSTDGVTE